MVGITLSPEQIQGAPPEVRRWLEQQIAVSLGLQRPPPPVEAAARHLMGCEAPTVRAILAMIQNALPVVGVFFELAREPAMLTQQGLRVLHLDDIMRHSRLQTPDQAVACLETINQALQQVSGDPQAALTALDSAGHCLVADVTARSILALWQQIVPGIGDTAREGTEPEQAQMSAQPGFQSPYAISVPPSAVTAGHQAT